MARPKEFDRDAALDRAIEVFWEKGYEEASMQDLVDRMEICRSSLYDTFGAKEDLYQAAIDRYIERADTAFRDALHGSDSPRGSIERLLRDQATRAGNPDEPTCLLVKCAVMRCRGCPDTAAKLERWLEQSVTRMQARLSDAADEGEISKEVAGRETARLLVNTILGLKVQGGVTGNRSALKRTAAAALRVLDH